MITEQHDHQSQPPRITPVAIDLAVVDQGDGVERVVMRVIDSETGARVDVVMPSRTHAAAFGRSLTEYSEAEPVWLTEAALPR